MAKDKVHPEQRAIYRETARRIVRADRVARKYGLSQNTIGEIERALVAAWQDGCIQGGMIERDEAVTGPTWLQLPARSRDTLRSLTFWFSKRHGPGEDRVDRIECFEAGGKPRWRQIDADDCGTLILSLMDRFAPWSDLGCLPPLPRHPTSTALPRPA